MRWLPCQLPRSSPRPPRARRCRWRAWCAPRPSDRHGSPSARAPCGRASPPGPVPSYRAGHQGRWSRRGSRCCASRRGNRARRCGHRPGGSPLPSFGWKLFIEAQASISVPSTEKCSAESSGLTCGSTRIAGRNATGDIACQQPLAVLGEHRHVPHRRVHRQADEPAEQHVVGQLLHQLPLGADAVEGLQQQRPQQLLRRDRGPADHRVQLPRSPARAAPAPHSPAAGSPAADDPAAPAPPG